MLWQCHQCSSSAHCFFIADSIQADAHRKGYFFSYFHGVNICFLQNNLHGLIAIVMKAYRQINRPPRTGQSRHLPRDRQVLASRSQAGFRPAIKRHMGQCCSQKLRLHVLIFLYSHLTIPLFVRARQASSLLL